MPRLGQELRGQLPLEGPAPGGAPAQASLSTPQSPRRSRCADTGSAGFVSPSQPERVSAAWVGPWELAPGGRLDGSPTGLEATSLGRSPSPGSDEGLIWGRAWVNQAALPLLRG